MPTISLRLADADRARLDVPEWVDVDAFSVSIREAIVLQSGVTLDTGQVIQFDSPNAWRQALRGEEVKGADGQPVLADVLDENGLPKLDSAGNFMRQPVRRPVYAAEMALVWLGLRRAGAKVPLADLDYDSDNLAWKVLPDEADPEPEPDTEASPGKDESTPPTTSGS